MTDDTDRTIMRRAPAQEEGGPRDVLHVLVIDGPGEPSRRVTLGRTPLRIGRVEGNDIVLASSDVSRWHCVIALEGEEAVVTDLGSTNGCVLDGRRIEGVGPLRAGARLWLGPFSVTHLRGPRAELERSEALERDMARAGRYVQALLPPPILDGPVRVDWRFQPSESLGGDGFGYRFLPDGQFAVWLLDVCGHGTSASLLAVSVMNLMREGGPSGCDPTDAAAVLAGLNTGFQMDRHGGLYFSLWYGVYDPASRILSYASAGQHPAYLGMPGVMPTPLWTRNPAIGLGSDARIFKALDAPVPAGGRLVLFSDGAFEATAPDGTTLGLADFLPNLVSPVPPVQPEAERLLSITRGLARAGPMEDDVSILVIDCA